MVKDTPGPGEYTLDYHHEVEIKGPKTFGSTVDRKINLNRDLATPFLDPSKEKNPPVGHYETSKKELERVHSKKPSALAHYLESSAIK